MDNEDQINEEQIRDLVAQSKKFFLRDDERQLTPYRGYNLAEEFAKTKKNKSPVVWLSVLLFTTIFIAMSVVLTLYIQAEAKRVPVGIADFADINLKDVLDKAKRYENEKNMALRKLEDLKAKMEREIEDARTSADREIALINNTEGLSAAEKNRRLALIRQRRENSIGEIQDRYNEQIEQTEREIEAAQEKIDEYDTRLLEKAREQEEILNNQRMKFELEIQETVNYYEGRIAELENQMNEEINSLKTYHDSFVRQLRANHANEIARLKETHKNEIAALKESHKNEIERLILLYNPIFDSPAIKRILAQNAGEEITEPPSLNEYHTVLQRENILNSEEFERLRSYTLDSEAILERLQQIPFKNSVSPALEQLRLRSWFIVREYEKLWAEMANVIEDKSMTINQFEHSLNSLVKKSRENGYILDPRKPDNIIVYIDRNLVVKTDDLGYVFRKDDDFIGTIEFNVSEKGITASLIALRDENRPIEPFDKILVQVK